MDIVEKKLGKLEEVWTFLDCINFSKKFESKDLWQKVHFSFKVQLSIFITNQFYMNGIRL